MRAAPETQRNILSSTQNALTHKYRIHSVPVYVQLKLNNKLPVETFPHTHTHTLSFFNYYPELWPINRAQVCVCSFTAVMPPAQKWIARLLVGAHTVLADCRA